MIPDLCTLTYFQDKLPVMSTPNYLALVTTPRIWPCKIFTGFIVFLAVVTRTTRHLEGLNSVSYWDSHNDSLSRIVSEYDQEIIQVFCSTVPSSEPPIVRYTTVSSAKWCICDDSFSGRSFMNTRKRIGSKT